MKKLLTIIAVACMVAVARAASVSWDAYAYDSAATTPLLGGTYWLVELGASADGIDDLIVYTDGTTNWGTYTQIGSAGTITNDDGGISGTIAKDFAAADNGTYYALIVWDGKENGYFGVATGQISGVVDSEVPMPADPISFINDETNGIVGANKATVTIPEPTVLALLALGVAGLALRRRA